MSKIALSGPAAGTATYTLTAPTGVTDRTIVLPDASGTILTTATPGVPVNGPAFSAYSLTDQSSITSGVETKVLFATELFDTNNNFASSRFTPTIAGYYQINTTIGIITGSAATASNWVSLFKNGAILNRANRIQTYAAFSGVACSTSQLVYFNGSTDYLEIYGFSNGGTWTAEGNSQGMTFFSAFLARSAT